MSRPLHELVKFRGDKLFNGAVNIDWFSTDATRSRLATESFVFHGPEYHGVTQADIGSSHGHRLQDTASFAQAIVRRCYGYEEEPFTLAIAGYGTGKSHLGLTLASLLCNPQSEAAQVVLEGIEAADSAIGRDIRTILRDANQPCLVVALNGMQSFDLTNQVTQQILKQLVANGLDTGPIDELRPRFAQAASLVRMANQDVVQELGTECETDSIDDLLSRLEQQDELIYRRVHDVFSRRGMILKALGGESVRDIVDTAARDFCGTGKPFRSLLVLFDEFGKYTEFATVKSQIAGSGVLQDLFEGVQSNSNSACFAGFIQFELNAYVQRIAPEYRNEILRYVTRYQSANRVYLSINMETLIANLIERKNSQDLARWFDNASSKMQSEGIMRDLGRWFPQAQHHRLWNDLEQFHVVVRKGCWPLSAYSTWFLFHLAAAGKHLQERSALALLGQLFDRFRDWQISDDLVNTLAPTDFWSEDLQHELITSEEGGHQGAITHAYASVIARHGASLAEDLQRLLRAVVLGSKLGLKASDRADAVTALSEIAGVDYGDADRGLRLLQEEFNVLEWDAAFKQFDILGDAVPRTQFLSWLRQRVASTYDDAGKAALFSSKAQQWCDLLDDLECDFAEENKITTREWRYQAVTSSLENLPMNLKLAADRWQNALAVDEPRGTIIYCYVGSGRDATSIESDASRLLRAAAKDVGVAATPTLVVLMNDEDGTLGQALAELAVLEESVSGEDRARFGNLIPAHLEKQRELVRSKVEAMIKQRRYATTFKEETEARRLGQAGSELFSRIYKSPITFPFDGFSTARGNAADSCQDLTRELLLGKLDYDAVMGKPVKVKNRAIAVLNDGWGIFAQNGKVLTRPKHPVVRNLTTKWDDLLANGERRLSVAEAIQHLCLPPYGANIASAGLLLGAFVAPRVDKLMVVRDGQQSAVSQWLQDGLFKGKYIDLNALRDVDLVSIGEASSEWEVLLDEWEQAESLLLRVQCLDRAEALRERVPAPPVLHYRVVHLEDLAKKAIATVADMERRLNEAFSKIENGYERTNLGLVTWGAAQIQEMCDRMRTEHPLWQDHQIDQVTPHVERARQVIIQGFSEWLIRQSPRSDSPDAVGEFKHSMLRLTGGNLKKLKLDDQCDALEKHVAQIVKNVETAVEAKQLIRDVRSWLTAHGDAHRSVRVAESRDLRDVGKELGNKLQGMSMRISLPELGDVRTALSESLSSIKEAEEKQVKRATRLWNVKLRSIEDLESSLEEIDSLVTAFEGCANDLNDLHQMRRALRIYHEDNKRLSDEHLTWAEFEALTEDLKQRATDIIGESDTPWPPTEVLDTLASSISKHRKQSSADWIESIEQAASTVESMSAADANRLRERVTAPPAVLTEPHTKRLEKVLKKVEKRLDALKLEWLLEKFKELDATLRKRFLQLIEKM
jgi:hypothetical protein